jgi:diaminopimelate epimerase
MRYFNFCKVNGAGNDFILIDLISKGSESFSLDEIIHLCDRRKGIGADGVLILYPAQEAGFFVDFYNADGSRGSLCGNGARCVILYAFEQGMDSDGELKFRFGDKIYRGELPAGGEPVFHLNRPSRLKKGFKIKARNSLFTAHYCDTGSPHLIVDIEDVPIDNKYPGRTFSDLSGFPVEELGRELRYHTDFAPQGVNVNFIKVTDEHNLVIRTWERGVEGETDACGTGSTAAAIIMFALGKVTPPVKLLTKSGDTLIIDFKIIDNKLENLCLTGPAEINFRGTIEL